MRLHALAVVGITGLALWPHGAQAAAVDLGTAAAFGVLASSTVTNTGASVIGGDVGVSPGTAITGFPPGSFTGTEHAGDAVAAKAQADASTAYNVAAGLASTDNLTGQDLGGLILTPGVYTFSSSAQLTGTLTLNGEGNPNAVFIFQIGSTLTTASASDVNLINGASGANVFWQVGARQSHSQTRDARIQGSAAGAGGGHPRASWEIRNDAVSSGAESERGARRLARLQRRQLARSDFCDGQAPRLARCQFAARSRAQTTRCGARLSDVGAMFPALPPRAR